MESLKITSNVIPKQNHQDTKIFKKPSNEIHHTFHSTEWLSKPESWNKELFTSEVMTFIENTQGHNAYPNIVLIGLLTHQIDIYVQCTRQIEQSGLIEAYNKGATYGPSIHFSMADKVLNRILQLMKELGLTPSHRIGSVKAIDTETLEIEELFAGH
jgi:phage terminase small subunit